MGDEREGLYGVGREVGRQIRAESIEPLERRVGQLTQELQEAHESLEPNIRGWQDCRRKYTEQRRRITELEAVGCRVLDAGLGKALTRSQMLAFGSLRSVLSISKEET